jgi:hypothetical protein
MIEDGGWRMKDGGLRCRATFLFKIKDFAKQSFKNLPATHYPLPTVLSSGEFV